jgi:hypothetical protein
MFQLPGFIHYINDGVTRDQTMALIISPGVARQWLWEHDGKYITT